MSDNVKLAGGLPQGDLNGFAGLAPQIVHDPDETHVALVLLKTSRLVTDVDSGTVLPILKVAAIEPIRVGPDAAEARRLVRRAFENRTGMVELPLEMERELEKLATDPDTGTAYDDRPATPGDLAESEDTLFESGNNEADYDPSGDGNSTLVGDDEEDAVTGSDTAPEAGEQPTEDELAAAERGEQKPAEDDPVVPDEFDQDGPNSFSPGFSDQS